MLPARACSIRPHCTKTARGVIAPLQHPLRDPEVSSNRLAFRSRLSSADIFRRNRWPRQSCFVDINVKPARTLKVRPSSVMPQCCGSSQRPTCSPQVFFSPICTLSPGLLARAPRYVHLSVWPTQPIWHLPIVAEVLEFLWTFCF